MIEYTIVAGLIAIVLVTMGPAFRRSVQQVVKSTADNIGFQEGAEQASDVNAGFVNSQVSNTRATVVTNVAERAGFYNARERQTTRVQSATTTNGAFVEQ